MPDESCRKCGNELKEFLKCRECNRPTQFECYRCGRKTNHQYHYNCNIGKEDPMKEILINNFCVIMPSIMA